MSTALADMANVVARVNTNTKVKVLARAFVQVDNYGIKFADDNIADDFVKVVEKAKYNNCVFLQFC